MTTDFTHYTYNRDLNWYFNAANLPNQKLAFATKEFIEQHRADEVTAEQFLNLLFRQKDAIKLSIDKPFDYLAHLQSIPLTNMLRHTLFGMLLYWHGGNPDTLLTEDANGQNYQTILKLVNEEFWKQFPDEATPEKSFCTNEPTQRKLREVQSALQAELSRQKVKVDIPHSRYMDNIDIDFGDLPAYVVDKAIVRKYEQIERMKDAEYSSWWNGLQEFINTIPQAYRVPALEKGIEYGQKCYDYHLANECTNPKGCPSNESWERRITMAKGALQTYKKSIEELERELATKTQTPEPEGKNPDFTTARQV